MNLYKICEAAIELTECQVLFQNCDKCKKMRFHAVDIRLQIFQNTLVQIMEGKNATPILSFVNIVQDFPHFFESVINMSKKGDTISNSKSGLTLMRSAEGFWRASGGLLARGMGRVAFPRAWAARQRSSARRERRC